MAYRHQNHRHHSCCRRGGAGKRVLYILAVGVVVAAAVSMFRSSDRYVSPPPAPAKLSEIRPSKLQEYAADRAIVGGAAAAERELAARPPDPVPNPERTVPVNVPAPRHPEPVAVTGRPAVDLSPGKPQPAIKLTGVRSDRPYPSRDMALNDALIVAAGKIQEKLRELDPPIDYQPGWEKVKAEYLRPETVKTVEPTPEQKQAWLKDGDGRIDNTNLVWAEIDVEVTDGQVRELRSENRVWSTGLIAAVGFVVVLALFGFLRLDAWTKGYLTGGLAVAVVAAAGAAVALLVLA